MLAIESLKEQSALSMDEATQPCSMRELLLYFLRLGAFGFGGPIALAGDMQHDLVETRRWISPQDFREGLALSPLSPAPLAAPLALYPCRGCFWRPRHSFYSRRLSGWSAASVAPGKASCSGSPGTSPRPAHSSSGAASPSCPFCTAAWWIAFTGSTSGSSSMRSRSR